MSSTSYASFGEKGAQGDRGPAGPGIEPDENGNAKLPDTVISVSGPFTRESARKIAFSSATATYVLSLPLPADTNLIPRKITFELYVTSADGEDFYSHEGSRAVTVLGSAIIVAQNGPDDVTDGTFADVSTVSIETSSESGVQYINVYVEAGAPCVVRVAMRELF